MIFSFSSTSFEFIKKLHQLNAIYFVSLQFHCIFHKRRKPKIVYYLTNYILIVSKWIETKNENVLHTKIPQNIVGHHNVFFSIFFFLSSSFVRFVIFISAIPYTVIECNFQSKRDFMRNRNWKEIFLKHVNKILLNRIDIETHGSSLWKKLIFISFFSINIKQYSIFFFFWFFLTRFIDQLILFLFSEKEKKI